MATEVADVPAENGSDNPAGMLSADVALSVAVAVAKCKAHHDDCKI